MTLKNYTQIRNVLLAILVLNFLVAFAKIIVGYASKTSSMVADGFHSFSDGTSNIIGLVGISIASKPADDDHPYGHSKYENMATIVISLMLFFIAFKMMIGAYSRFLNPVIPNIDSLNFIVMIVTLIVNIFVTKYESKKGIELKSSILISDAAHTQSDVFVSISVILGFFAIKAGLIWVDTIVSFGIGLMIIKAGFEILLPNFHTLTDKSPINTLEIELYVKNISSDIKYVHKIRAWGNRNLVNIDMHIGVDSNMSIERAHEISHLVQRSLQSQFEDIHDVLIHTEPYKEKEDQA